MNIPLEKKRKEIDLIDESIVELLNRRSTLAREISVVKMSSGLPISDPSRENEVIDRVVAATRDRSDRDAVERIFRVILRESRQIQARISSEIAVIGAQP